MNLISEAPSSSTHLSGLPRDLDINWQLPCRPVPKLDSEDDPPRQEIIWRQYMRRLQSGDELALEALYAESYRLVFTTAVSILGFAEDAEEIAADVLTRAWSKSRSFEPTRGSVSGWLVSMARSRAIDRLRARTVRTRMESASVPQPIGGQTPESTLNYTERQNDLHLALQCLPFEQRRTLELFYFSELPVANIAARLQQPRGTVKTRLRSARLALRRHLSVHQPATSTVSVA